MDREDTFAKDENFSIIGTTFEFLSQVVWIVVILFLRVAEREFNPLHSSGHRI